MSQIVSAGIEHLSALRDQGKIAVKSDILDVLRTFDDSRKASFQDIKNRDQNEWRYVATTGNDPLLFDPTDVQFILVRTWDEAKRWNDRLNNGPDKTMTRYGKAGVLAIPFALFAD
jgi:hypothetical protein